MMTLRRSLLIILIALCLLGAGVVLAQEISLPWTTAASGGGASAGGAYTLVGTLGQSEAGQPASGGGYILSGGVWGGTGSVGSNPDAKPIYLPVIQK